MSTLESVLVKAPHQTNIHKVFCTAPWRGLHIDPTGDVKVCCAGKRFALGNLNSSSIEEVLTGTALDDLRKEMLEGQRPDYCRVCIDCEKHGGDSERHWHLKVDSDFDPETADLDRHLPSIIDVRWNNTCNLKCSYCFSMASSRWAAHEGQRVDTSTRRYYKDVENFMRHNSDNLKEVALIGGEPLLLPENHQFIDIIPDHANIVVISNLSVPLERNEVFQRLRRRSNVRWNISFENTNDRFEFVRDGAQWQTLVDNLAIVDQLCDEMNHTCGVHALFNIFVVTRLDEILQFAHDRSLKIMWQTLIFPEYFDPLNLGPEVAQLAVNTIDSALKHDYSRPYTDYLLQARGRLSAVKESRLREKFKEKIQDRRENFVRLWPELEFLLQ